MQRLSIINLFFPPFLDWFYFNAATYETNHNPVCRTFWRREDMSCSRSKHMLEWCERDVNQNSSVEPVNLLFVPHADHWTDRPHAVSLFLSLCSIQWALFSYTIASASSREQELPLRDLRCVSLSDKTVLSEFLSHTQTHRHIIMMSAVSFSV